ncbi:MAG: septal ring lytic transglycosylase RlpA family protein [Candidatus Latescibacterota bacterium]|nr:MAG: septal ring lytic transglycosylase RlpA family protein [Candidatus Latescibacterota bacterium]
MRSFGASLVVVGLGVCAAITPFADARGSEFVESGIASWYGPGFAGRPTASGEIYDPDLLTAAHKTLPLGTLVRVHNLDNDRSMIVRINDRGPFIRGRIIDLSRAAAEVLGYKDAGLANVRISTLAPPQESRAPTRRGTLMQQAADMADEALERLRPVSRRSTAPAPAPKQAPEPHGEEGAYFVQVGAFRESGYAYDLVERIEPLSMQWKVEFEDDMYRVLIGPYASSADANRAMEELESSGIAGFLRASR